MTAETKHTPGPWLIHSALLGHNGDVFSPTAKKVTDCHHIARCFAPKPDAPVLSDLHAIQASREAIEIIEANARLIAAAPEMAEALRIARTFVVACRAEAKGRNKNRFEYADTVVSDIDAVLQKAGV